MSIYSEYECGAMSYYEFREACKEENRRDRWDREHEYIDFWEQDYYENEDEEDE